MMSIIRWNIPGVTFIPKGNLLNLYKPLYVFIVDKFVHFPSNYICTYASDKSSFENILPLYNFVNISSGLDDG